MTGPINYPNQQFPAYSGVTINVSNPLVNAGNPYVMPQACTQQCMHTNPYAMQATPVAQPYYQQQPPVYNVTPQPTYPPQYYLNNYNYVNSSDKNPQSIPVHQQGLPQNMQEQTFMQQPQFEPDEYNLNKSQGIISDLNARNDAQKELEKNGKQTRVVALTNEYIMSLENYLNNPNAEIRLMAAQDILTRLDEDKSRYDDAALNALLNKMLQDPNKIIRVAALSAFSSQLACGNDYTVHLLKQIQNNPNGDKEDAIQAANALLKMSTKSEIKYVPVKNKDSKKSSNKNEEALQKQVELMQKQLQKYKEKEVQDILAQQKN